MHMSPKNRKKNIFTNVQRAKKKENIYVRCHSVYDNNVVSLKLSSRFAEISPCKVKPRHCRAKKSGSSFTSIRFIFLNKMIYMWACRQIRLGNRSRQDCKDVFYQHENVFEYFLFFVA